MPFAPIVPYNMGSGAFDDETRPVVEAHLRKLSMPALAAFVADLWAAKGFDTELDGTVLKASIHGETQVVAVGAAGVRAAEGTADIVVDLAGGSYDGSSVVDAAGLSEQLWYAVDRPVARRLCEEHLGAAPAALSPPLSYRFRWGLRRSRSPAGAVVAVALLVAVAAVVAVGAGVVPTDGAENATPTPTDNTDAPIPAVQAGVPAGDWDTSPINQPLPPGVRPDGISNLTTLNEAHADALANRSHTLGRNWSWMAVRDQEVVEVQRTIDTVVDGDEYRIETDDTLSTDGTQVGVLYHDGRFSYVAQNASADADYRRLGPTEQWDIVPQAPSQVRESLVETRLSTPTTDLTGTVERNNRTLYRVTGSGRPDWPTIGGVEEYNVTALVTLSGFVRQVDARYTVRSGTRTVEVHRVLRYSRVGETTVEPPAWYQTTSDRNQIGG